MTSMSELKRMLEGDGRDHGSRPDVTAIVGRGRRLRRRRQLGVASVAAVCCLAIAIPVGVRVGTDDGRGSDAPVAPLPDRTTTPPDSGSRPGLPDVNYSCRTSLPRQWPRCHEGSGGPARPLGAVLDTGVWIEGSRVYLLAQNRPDVYGPDESVRIPTVAVGYRNRATDRLEAYAPLDGLPGDGELPIELVTTGGHGPWIAIGAVSDADASTVVAVEPDGSRSPIEVTLSEREVAPGLRVFWASGDDYSDPDLPVEFRILDAQGHLIESGTVLYVT